MSFNPRRSRSAQPAQNLDENLSFSSVSRHFIHTNRLDPAQNIKITLCDTRKSVGGAPGPRFRKSEVRFRGGRVFAQTRDFGSVDSVNRHLNVKICMLWYFNRFEPAIESTESLFQPVDDFGVGHPPLPGARKAKSSRKTWFLTVFYLVF